MSLRRRIGMGRLWGGARLRGPGHDYMVRAVATQATSHDARPADAGSTRRRAVRLWLLAVAALVFAMVVVGGATRLTESGLSIVEWKPVTGTLPPLGDGALAGRVREVQGDPAVSASSIAA